MSQITVSPSSIIFENNVQMPSRMSVAKKYRLVEMEVGQSFLVSFDNEDYKRVHSLMAGIRVYGKSTGKRFISRNVADGVRVWRTS